MLVQRHRVHMVYTARKPCEVPARGPTASGVVLGSVGGRYRIFTPSKSTRINTARDCNRLRLATDTEGRGSFSRNESRSRERSAFNRIKHVSFLRPCNPPWWQNVNAGVDVCCFPIWYYGGRCENRIRKPCRFLISPLSPYHLVSTGHTSHMTPMKHHLLIFQERWQARAHTVREEFQIVKPRRGAYVRQLN